MGQLLLDLSNLLRAQRPGKKRDAWRVRNQRRSDAPNEQDQERRRTDDLETTWKRAQRTQCAIYGHRLNLQIEDGRESLGASLRDRGGHTKYHVGAGTLVDRFAEFSRSVRESVLGAVRVS